MKVAGFYCALETRLGADHERHHLYRGSHCCSDGGPIFPRLTLMVARRPQEN